MPREDAGSFSLRNQNILLWILGLSILSLLPFFIFHIHGDVVAHYFNMNCFGKAMWEGNLYPRWCGYANDGIGSPAMFFYFPLAYFISSIFYPLLGIEQLYILQLFLNHMVTLLGCLLWFRRYTGLRAALILAAFYLWFPYRSELVFYRSALAELWAIALIPWVMWMLGRLKNHHKEWPFLALLLALCILAHTPATAVLLVSIAILFATKTQPLNTLPYVLKALATALALTVIYWLPAILYQNYVMGNTELALFDIYPNRQPMVEDFGTSRIRILLGGLASFSFCVMFCITLLRNNKINAQPTLKRPVLAALIMACVALFVLLPLSAPLFQAINHFTALSQIFMPWRFQALWLIGTMITVLAALQLPMIRKSWKMDVSMLTILLIVLSVFVMVAFAKKLPEEYPVILAHDILPLKEYRTIWQKTGFDKADLLAQVEAENSEIATIIKGRAQIQLAKIKQDEISLDVDAASAVTLRIHHLYFPSWQVVAPENIGLNPEPVRGLMQLYIPKGAHHIVLKQNAYSSKVSVALPYLPVATILLWLTALFIAMKNRARS